MLNLADTRCQKASRYRFVIAGLLGFLAFSMSVNMFATGPIVPMIIDQYGTSNSMAGLLSSVIFLVQIPFAVPASTLVGRIGLKRLITLAAVTGSATLLTFIVAESFFLVLSLRAIYGVGMVLMWPAVGPLLMQWFNSRELPMVNGVFMLCASLGVVVSNMTIVQLSEAVGWEMALSVFGGVSAFGVMMWLSFGKARTIQVGDNISGQSINGSVWGVLRSRNTILVGIADAGPLALLSVSQAWLPTFYYREHGMGLSDGGTLMGLLSISGFVALILASVLPIWFKLRRPFLILPGMIAGFAALASLLLVDLLPPYIAVVFLGFACWFYVPALVTVAMELHTGDPRQVAVILACLMSIGGVAGFVSPPLVGAVSDLTGSLMPGLAIFAVFGWSLAIAGLLIPETGIRDD